MKRRTVVTVVGLLAVGWGLAVAVAPGLATMFPLQEVFVKVVGVLAFVQGLRVIQQRRRTDVEGADTGDPETNVTLPTPGQEFDELLRTVHSGHRKRLIRSRKELRQRLERSLVAAITRRDGCSVDEARTQIETGRWTDDPEAAAFLGGPSAPRRSWREWLRRSLGSETAFQHRARKTADAVARYVEESQ
ncbi:MULTISPECIES: hypothetical protein [unclassified Haladaptatus]|uniref:DUF7269 family protein n=1 Tax=unclassified Haladaptatus TaxID=2622732 RepID=UPI00209C48AF|nr:MULTISPECIES: hypothetical protein [unclassified Haladaptatus]MCO8247039.1 hypothetical protein [Haladaptatus sp. AB643]MCO8254577.1 hypothetical protein [Haladaptatus sp. AB618]